jgi:pyruvate dehydrogenase E2 component (dihydrolipoamide acetyltransferase)
MSSVEFKLPDLGENIEAGEVLSVLVSAGDQLEENQPVIELETDKAVIEVPSSVSGRITEVHVSQGDRAAVGQLILTLDGAADDAAEAPSAAAEPAAAPVAAAAPAGGARAELHLPELGEGVDGGDVIGILVAVGDSIAVDQPVIEIEIDKGVVEMPASVAGVVEEIHVKKGDRTTEGQLILVMNAASASPTVEAAAPVEVKAATAPPAPTGPPPVAPAPVAAATTVAAPARKLIPAAPSVRRFAREIGIDIAQVTGSGPRGRLSIQDIKTHAKGLNAGRTQATPAGVEAPPLPDFTKWGEIEREPMSNVRRITASHMARAWATIPHVTQFDKADVTQLEVWRKQFAKRAEAAGGKLTPTAIVLKIAAAALRKFPQFCASIDMAGEEVIYKKYCHIGVAVDTPRGLLVPVVRDVDRKNIIELAVELTEIAQKARNGKLAIDDMQGGCFTISNLGGIGGTAFTPIVNAPEVGILGIARSNHEPVLVDGQFEPRLMMPLSLSFDHRLIDGANGARFLRWLCEAVENPFLLALEG